MKKSLIVLIAVIMAVVMAFGACSKEAGNTEENPTEAASTASITADDAKAVALDKAGVPETAAENLEVTETEYEGASAYLVKFEWSGFEYEFTIDSSNGKIVHYIFDGSEMEVD